MILVVANYEILGIHPSIAGVKISIRAILELDIDVSLSVRSYSV